MYVVGMAGMSRSLGSGGLGNLLDGISSIFGKSGDSEGDAEVTALTWLAFCCCIA
jgi:hypothetical protein